jgi:hypothetical protein
LTAAPAPALAQEQPHASLPYHYSHYEGLYVCNLCNCTYDSLRSIKAHLWKHSGHRELSYPIHDYNTARHGNKAQPAPGGTQLFQLEAPNVAKESPSGCSSGSLASPSAQRAGGGGGGICSALLEVIEKLRDEEESTDESSAESESGRKRRKLAKQQREESEEHRECRIETSVVSSLLDDDYCLSQGDVLLPPGEPAPAKPRITSRKARSKKQQLQASEAGALAARNTG